MKRKITEDFIKENSNKRFTVTTDNGKVFKNIKFFYSTNGHICYLSGRQKHRGLLFPYTNEYVEVIEVTKKPKEYTVARNATKILKKIHPNAWPTLKAQMEEAIKGNPNNDFKWHFEGKLRFKNITKLLTFTEKETLKAAFENKNDFTWRRDTYKPSGRDLSIKVQKNDDGTLNGYFSSEYMGCLNGDYWLLLNPTTAIYYEKD